MIAYQGAAHLYEDLPTQTVQGLGSIDEVLAVARAAGAETADAVVPLGELSVLAAATLRDYFDIGDPDRRIGTAIAARFIDKARMKDDLAAAGIPVANHASGTATEVGELCRDVGFPVVVKPAIGSGSRHTVSLVDDRELRAGLADEDGVPRVGDIIVESFVEMRAELHCDFQVADSAVVFAATSRYMAPLLGSNGANGSVVLGPGHRHDTGVALAQRVVDALELTDGVCHLEFFDTVEGPVVGEVAARPAGGGIVEAVALGTGVDLWERYLDSCLGPTVTPDPRRGTAVPTNRRLPDGVAAWCGLPARNGRVVSMTDSAALLALPYVHAVHMEMEVGDTVQRPAGSTSWAGIVVYEAPTEVAAVATAGDLWSMFSLSVA